MQAPQRWRGMRAPAPRIDPFLSVASRFGVVRLLDTTRWCRLIFIRETLAISGSTLTRQLRTLGQAGYVRTERAADGTVWVRLTAAGYLRFDEHLAALQALAAGVNPEVTAAQQAHPEWFRQVTE